MTTAILVYPRWDFDCDDDELKKKIVGARKRVKGAIGEATITLTHVKIEVTTSDLNKMQSDLRIELMKPVLTCYIQLDVNAPEYKGYDTSYDPAHYPIFIDNNTMTETMSYILYELQTHKKSATIFSDGKPIMTFTYKDDNVYMVDRNGNEYSVYRTMTEIGYRFIGSIVKEGMSAGVNDV